MRSVFVTGASSGIGLSTCRLLAGRGWRVFAGVRRALSSHLKQEYRSLGAEVIFCDLSRPARIRAALQVLFRKTVRLDALVNNAGVGSFGAVEEHTEEEAAFPLKVNVYGLHEVTRLVLPRMRAQGHGRIVHIGSVAGFLTFPGSGFYSASKHAVEALGESLAWEVSPWGVSVTVLEMGQVKTPFHGKKKISRIFQSKKSAYQEKLQAVWEFSRRMVQKGISPEDVAEAVGRILEDKDPPLRKTVGLPAALYALGWKMLPQTWIDRAAFRMLPWEGGRRSPSFEPPRSGQVVLVTGANSGIGLAIARKLAGEGLRIYGTYRSPRRSRELFELSRELPITPVSMDVREDSSIQRTVRRILKKEGILHGLVNNAGFVFAGFLEDVTARDLQEQFEVNVLGAWRCAKAVLPILRRAGGGWIVQMGSISGRVGFPALGAYCASKHALWALSWTLRMEAAHFNVAVGELDPGSHRSRVYFSAKFPENWKNGTSAYRHFGRVIQSEMEKSLVEKGAPPDRVAEELWKMLKQGQLPPYRFVGWDAKVYGFCKRRLPQIFWKKGVSAYLKFLRWRSGSEK